MVRMAQIALIALLGGFSYALADFRHGNALLGDCTSENLVQGTLCLGYVDAVADILVKKNAINGFTACIPRSGIISSQVRDIVIQFLRLNAAQRHYGASGLVAHAISDAFPCR